MSGHANVQIGMDRFRVGAWQADDRVAYIAPAPGGLGPSPGGVRACIERLQAEGFSGAITSALRAEEARSFESAGFQPHEALHILRRDLDDIDAADRAVRHRRARQRDRDGVLKVDHAAFTPFWRLDGAGLDEAVHATPSTRFRVVQTREIVAYAVCGRAERIGYLQRLAVHPTWARHGMGSALVIDALSWLRRRGANEALVNTQESNVAAVTLYQRLGFVLDREQLHVLRSHW